jgi:alanyl aminopeptidase
MNLFNQQRHTNFTMVLLFISSLIVSQTALASEQNYRLPQNVIPSSQYIELTLDPDKDNYFGHTITQLHITKSTNKIALHGIDLQMKSIQLTLSGKTRELTASKGEYDIIWLTDEKPIKAGNYQLKIEFTASYSNDALGLYKTSYQNVNYLFTQFEMLFARRAFPVFDEPSVKIPYQLTLTVPKKLQVATNTPVIDETVNGKNKTVRFKKTPPMSSYLIAITVGDLDKTPIQGLSIPGFIYSPKGTGNATGFAIKHTPQILKALEQYFAIDYPYEKLDFVAVPDFAFGAMENPGLVTYRTELLLRGDSATANQAASTLSIIAHELAHMWYGNLVTMKWWDDLWLNEAFATWMSSKVMDTHYPQYQEKLQLPQEGALYEDGLSSTKAIRKEVKTAKDVEDGLGLNYTKGHAILNMLEQTIGEEKFQLAIQKYMSKYKWENTVADDLWRVLAEQSEFNIGAIASTFLNQPGYALISFDEKGTISQKRYKNFGAEIPEQTWQVPLSIKYKLNGKIKESSVLLSADKTQLQTLIEADWYLPVANGNGYFRWKLPKDKYEALLSGINELTDREKMALLSNSIGLLNAGEISIKEHLTLLTLLAKENNPIVFLKAIEEIKIVGETHSTLNNQYAFSDYITQTLTPWYNKIGSVTKADDNDSILQLRPRLLRTLGQLGNNPTLNKELGVLAKKYLAGDKGIDDSLGREALRIAAMLDKGQLVKTYYKAYLTTTNATLRSNIMASMYFTDKKSVSYVLEQTLKDDIPAGDKSGPLSGLFYISKDQSYIYQWITPKFAEVVSALPQIYKGYMPFIMSPGCQQGNIIRFSDFFEAQGADYNASFVKALEEENNCLALKLREAKSFNEFLSPYQHILSK